MTEMDWMYLKTLLIFLGILAYLAMTVLSWIHLGLMKWPPSRRYFLLAVLFWPIGVPWFWWLNHRYMKAMRRKSFTGQVIDNISDRILTVWDLDAGGSYRAVGLDAVGIDPNSFPVGSLAICILSKDESFITTMVPANERTMAKYRSKILIPVAGGST